MSGTYWNLGDYSSAMILYEDSVAGFLEIGHEELAKVPQKLLKLLQHSLNLQHSLRACLAQANFCKLHARSTKNGKNPKMIFQVNLVGHLAGHQYSFSILKNGRKQETGLSCFLFSHFIFHSHSTLLTAKTFHSL